MSSPKPSFTAALLYSNRIAPSESQAKLLTRVRSTINQDPLLKRILHQINVDLPDFQDILASNPSQTKVTHYPVFVVRYSQRARPIIYELGQVNYVFAEIYHKIINPSLEGSNDPPTVRLESLEDFGDSSELSSSLDQPNKEQYHQDKGLSSSSQSSLARSSSFEEYSSKVEDQTNQLIIRWNLENFPQSGHGQHLSVQPKDRLVLQSTDHLQHNVTLTDASWTNLRSIICETTSQVDLTIPIIFNPGCYYLMDSCYPERIRLILIVNDPPSSLIRSKEKSNMSEQDVKSIFDQVTVPRAIPNKYVFRTKPDYSVHRGVLDQSSSSEYDHYSQEEDCDYLDQSELLETKDLD